MSLLGKILAIFNVVGLVVFVFLGLMVYAKRQSWSHAVHRQDVALNGLPLSGNEVDQRGVPLADKFYEVDRKVLEYLEAGVRLVWVVNPDCRHVWVNRHDGSVQRLREQDELNGEDVLPGFRCPLRLIFHRPTTPPAGP